MKLTGDTVHSWPTNDQLPVVSLSIKYAILHKIGIANWILSIHASTISTSLGQLIYLIGTSSRIDHPTILSTLDVVGLKPKTIAPSFRLFQDTCS
ncbi:envelope-like protein [Cucumis melo var. makuwa]|uniref:Envelope-like protein n=1 Tax=Cucumis melo var. makuwa TaxID=1194695 RepID=A0A5A7SI43_CUCMM|nr:envelope-like protein [Cucumis melo var. makuwa]TYK09618.1 envelope-like protein [Cucumis melo var. makuwa]